MILLTREISTNSSLGKNSHYSQSSNRECLGSWRCLFWQCTFQLYCSKEKSIETASLLVAFAFASSLFPGSLQPVIPTSPTSNSTTPTSTMPLSSKLDSSTLQDVFILSPMSGLYSPRYIYFCHESWFCRNWNFRVGSRPKSIPHTHTLRH